MTHRPAGKSEYSCLFKLESATISDEDVIYPPSHEEE